MPSANLDLVRSTFDAFGRGDWSSTEWADPELEFVIVDGPEPVSGRGLDAYSEWLHDFLRAWEGYRLGAEKYRELDDERVLVFVRASGGRATASGVELGQLGWAGAGGAVLCEIRAGKIARLVIYFDRDRALADVGFAPDSPGS